MKKIFFIAPSAYPLGGVQVWLTYLVSGLKRCNWEVVLGLTEGRYHNVKAYLEAHPFDQVERISAPTGTRQGRINAIAKSILHVEPDVVVVVNIVDVYEAVARLRARGLTKSKLVATCHGIGHDYFQDFRLYRSLIDAVVCTNRLTQKLVCSISDFDDDRVLYAACGVAETTIPDQKRDSQRDKVNGSVTICYVGRFENSQKRISDLILIMDRILHEHMDVRFLIAGDGEERPTIENWIAKHEHGDNVNYLGVLNSEQIDQEVYLSSDIMILTSQWETGPIVAWEAMSRGVTLVSSRYIGLEEEGSLVNNINCLLFDIGDIDSAVKVVKEAFDPQLRRNLSTKAATLTEKQYSLQTSIDQWHSCFVKSTILPDYLSPPESMSVVDAGRLNKIFRPRFAEWIRKVFMRKLIHRSAGGEWPHTLSSASLTPLQLVGHGDLRTVESKSIE